MSGPVEAGEGERFALAEVLYRSRVKYRGPVHTTGPEYDWADDLLASDWLAERDARVAAEAWDEGFDAGERDVFNHEQAGWRDAHPCIPNPYRRADGLRDGGAR